MAIKLKVTTMDLLKGKFSDTIAAIKAVKDEAKGDELHGTAYTAKSVRFRAERIQIAFEKDLINLSNDINIEE